MFLFCTWRLTVSTKHTFYWNHIIWRLETHRKHNKKNLQKNEELVFKSSCFKRRFIYGCEIWVINKTEKRCLAECFQNTVSETNGKISCAERVTDEDMYIGPDYPGRRKNIHNNECHEETTAGHVLRHDEESHPTVIRRCDQRTETTRNTEELVHISTEKIDTHTPDRKDLLKIVQNGGWSWNCRTDWKKNMKYTWAAF